MLYLPGRIFAECMSNSLDAGAGGLSFNRSSMFPRKADQMNLKRFFVLGCC
jgi:hypothetical protein